jgi:hypothetical protein
MLQRLIAAGACFVAAGFFSLIILGLIASFLELTVRSVLPGALVVGALAAVWGFYYPKVALRFLDHI